jgi:hypothetical protein
MFLDTRWQNFLELNGNNHSLIESALKFFKMQLQFVTDIPKYLNSATFSNDYE